MSDLILNAEDCARAIVRGVQAMGLLLDVHQGILRLIAEFVPYGEFVPCCTSLNFQEQARDVLVPTNILTFQSPGFANAVVAKFDTGPHLEYFDVSNDGLTATRKRGYDRYRCVCASPRFDSGT